MTKQTVWLWRSLLGISSPNLSSTLSASTGATVPIQTSPRTYLSIQFPCRRCQYRNSAQRYLSCWRSFAEPSKPGAPEARAKSPQHPMRGRSLGPPLPRLRPRDAVGRATGAYRPRTGERKNVSRTRAKHPHFESARRIHKCSARRRSRSSANTSWDGRSARSTIYL